MPRKRRKKLKKWVWVVVVCGLGLLFAAGGAVYLLQGMPSVSSIETYRPNLASKLYTVDGREFAQFAVERRTLVPLSSVPKKLIQAVVAVEDSHFYQHHGIDWSGILRAMIKNIRAGRIVQGGSTITQQLARALFLTPERTFIRKLREVLLAMLIERKYSKQEIMELYLNQIYFGHGAYGVEAAARTYFGKDVSQLKLVECAMLAGLPRAPNRYSPLRHPERAKARRRHVLKRMLEEGFITQTEYQAALKEELQLVESVNFESPAPYFTEYVRKYLERRYGSRSIYRDGLRIYTTLDLHLQELAHAALRKGIRELDKRRGFRPIDEHTQLSPDIVPEPDLGKLEEGALYLGRIEARTKDGLQVKVGACRGVVPRKYFAWVGKAATRKYLQPGARVVVQVLKAPAQDDGEEVEYVFSLEQQPEVQGAIVVLDPTTGYILAMDGGYDFALSKFNRATQARRQPGSAFKPIIYAAALEAGYTLGDILLDAPIIYRDEEKADDWKPANYYQRFYGPTTLRKALEHSRNVVTVKLLDKIGIQRAIQMARKLGISTPLAEDLSLALGSSGVSLLELTSAYGVFANSGVRLPPIAVRYVADSEGRILEERKPQPEEVLDARIAYLMASLLQGVVEHGTGWRARRIGRPLAGKTGTTNHYIDAWFIGFTPDLAAGVWVGLDEQKTLGPVETGSRAASPIWVDFMEKALEERPIKDFSPPPGIVRVSIDAQSGMLATEKCQQTLMEDFIAGTQPTEWCDKHGVEKDKFFMVDMDLALRAEELGKDTEKQPAEPPEADWGFD